MNAIRLTAKKRIRPRVERALHETAEDMVIFITDSFEPSGIQGGGSDQFPVWRGNLRDGTGVGVYIDGALSKYVPTPVARGTQFGAAMLNEALEEAQTTFAKGFYVVLFSEAPYADYVNENGSKWLRGFGFMDVLRERMTSQIPKYLKLKKIL